MNNTRCPTLVTSVGTGLAYDIVKPSHKFSTVHPITSCLRLFVSHLDKRDLLSLSAVCYLIRAEMLSKRVPKELTDYTLVGFWKSVTPWVLNPPPVDFLQILPDFTAVRFVFSFLTARLPGLTPVTKALQRLSDGN